MLAAPESNAATPAAPNVTVGADIKQLIFDWDDVAGAAYYRLMYKVGSGDWKLLIDNIPASTTQVEDISRCPPAVVVAVALRGGGVQLGWLHAPTPCSRRT